MVAFSSTDKDRRTLYKLIIGTIVPRPIAWVSSVSAAGQVNLAPFSYFNGVCPLPPTLAFTVGDREGEMKDTSRNIAEVGEFTVHIVSESVAERMNVTCGEYGAHIDEFVEAGLTAVPGTMVRTPRVAEALVAMECRLSHHLRVGEPPQQSSHILGEVLYWHIDDSVIDERHRILPDRLLAVGRLGGNEYSRIRDRFEMPRPQITADDPRSIEAYKARQAREAGK